MLDGLTAADLDRLIYRHQGHTIMEAINRQLAHYPYHVGQLVFMGKLLADRAWQSLCILSGTLAAYNAERLALPLPQKHFTDEKLGQQPV